MQEKPEELQRLRQLLARAAQVIEELLKLGEHEGECTNAETFDGPCDLHMAASEARCRDAQAFLRCVPLLDPSLTELQVEKLFHAIEHGNAQHRQWLRDKLREFFHIG